MYVCVCVCVRGWFVMGNDYSALKSVFAKMRAWLCFLGRVAAQSIHVQSRWGTPAPAEGSTSFQVISRHSPVCKRNWLRVGEIDLKDVVVHLQIFHPGTVRQIGQQRKKLKFNFCEVDKLIFV